MIQHLSLSSDKGEGNKINRFNIFLDLVAKCDFDSGLCSQWSQSTSDQFDWTVGSGTTPSSGTGPSADHSGSGKSDSATLFYFRVFSTFVSYELLLLVWQLEKYGLLKHIDVQMK